jgi:hypothetical protein
MDEAMAAVIAGELSAYFTGIIYCSLIDACLELSELRRAGEWSDAAQVWCDALPEGSSFPGMCRANRAQLSRLRGAWAQAETEAAQAADELLPVEPGLAASAFRQLGEVRLRVGDLDGAEERSRPRMSWDPTRSRGWRSCGPPRESGCGPHGDRGVARGRAAGAAAGPVARGGGRASGRGGRARRGDRGRGRAGGHGGGHRDGAVRRDG